MRGTKSAFISMLAISLLAGSAVGVASQDEAAAEPSTPTRVTGHIVGVGEMVQEPAEAEVDGVLQLRGFAVEGERIEMDDPRLTGSVSVAINHDIRTVGDVDAVLLAVSQRIENEGAPGRAPVRCWSSRTMGDRTRPRASSPARAAMRA